MDIVLTFVITMKREKQLAESFFRRHTQFRHAPAHVECAMAVAINGKIRIGEKHCCNWCAETSNY